jgi:hypothetical protein
MYGKETRLYTFKHWALIEESSYPGQRKLDNFVSNISKYNLSALYGLDIANQRAFTKVSV